MSLMRDVLERSACLDRTGMHYIMCEDRQCIILVWYIAGFVVYEALMRQPRKKGEKNELQTITAAYII